MIPVRGSAFRHVEMVMGTAVTFDFRGVEDADQDRLTAVLADATRWLHWVDETFTTYSPDSVVMRLGRGELTLDECPRSVADVVGDCERARALTDGWFDPWAGPVPFDPSGLVKGWAAELASDILIAGGFGRHCVNAGGDVVVRGFGGPDDDWGVGISNPLVPRTICAVVTANNEAVATSGAAERGHHVWSPRDNAPATDLASVTVIHRELATADVYATAAFAMGRDAVRWLADRPDTDSFVVDAAGREWASAGFTRRRTWPPREPAATAR